MKAPETVSRQITDIIQQLIGTCSIYVFGYSEPHFYILVFADTKVTGSYLVNEIKERSNKTITATVLVHNTKHLSTQQKSQQYFFHQVLHNAQRLALDKANVPYILNHTPERDLETDSRFWQKCVAVAQFDIQAAKDSPQVDVTLCKVALLNCACVQAALGLIRMFLGYTPNEFGLNYLLQLCGHFTDLPAQVFARETPEAVKRYKMLCAPPSMLLHWTRLDADEEDFEILLEHCETFLDSARVVATVELERLQTLTPTV